MPEAIATCNLCDAMCGLILHVEGDRLVRVRGNPDDLLSRGHLCPKGAALPELLHDPERLREPMQRTENGWQPIAWDDAYDLIETRLRQIRRRHGRHAIATYIGNPTAHSHRAALGSALLNATLGTHHSYNPNSQDSYARLFACWQLYGDPLSVPVPDIEHCELLYLFGANPAVSAGSMWGLGDVHKRLRGVQDRGGRIVLFDPRKTETAALANTWHPITPGSDAALLLAMLHVLFAENLMAVGQIQNVANGLTDLRAVVQPFSPELVAPWVGIDAATIRQLAVDLARTEKACVYGRIGISQNEFAPIATWLVEVLNLVTGHWDRRGGAMFPQPPADLAPLARLLAGDTFGRWHSNVRQLPEFLGTLPSATLAEDIETEHPERIRALICFAGNPLLTVPNARHLKRALQSLELLVSVDFYLNETAELGHVVLPPLHVLETGNFDLLMQRFSVQNVAKWSSPVLPRPETLQDDWQILAELALRMTVPKPLRKLVRGLMHELPDRAMELLLKTGRFALTRQQLLDHPHGIDLGPLQPAHGRHVHTHDGKVNLAPTVFLERLPALLERLHRPRPELLLVGRRDIKSNNSWNHNLPSLAKGPVRHRLWMHPDDAKVRGITDGSLAEVTSRAGQVTVAVKVTEGIVRGAVSLPHGWGHDAAGMTVAAQRGGVNANLLTDDTVVEPCTGLSILSGYEVRVVTADSAKGEEP